MLGVIRHGDADLFVAKGVCQLAGMVPAVGGVGFGGELYGVPVAEGVAEAGAVQGHGGALMNVVGVGVLAIWKAWCFRGPSSAPTGRGLMFLFRVVGLACAGCRWTVRNSVGFGLHGGRCPNGCIVINRKIPGCC